MTSFTPTSWKHSKKIKVKTLKEDSVWLYFLMESLEGLTAYSTLPHHEGDHYRDLLLTVPPDFFEEVLEFLEDCNEKVLKVDIVE